MEHGCWEVSKPDITAAEKLGGRGLGAPGKPWGREGRSWQGCGLPLAPLSCRLEERPAEAVNTLPVRSCMHVCVCACAHLCAGRAASRYLKQKPLSVLPGPSKGQLYGN